MELSIIIVNWNTRDYLQECLRSVYAHPPRAQFEVIVIDNASADGSAHMVAHDFPTVVLVANDRNLGYAEANNQGIRMASGRFLLLLNPDTEVKSATFDALLSFAASHPEAAATGCRLVHPDGRLQMSCRSFPEPLPVLFEYLRLSRLFPNSTLLGRYRCTFFDYAAVSEVDQPMGSCLLLSGKAVEDIGMFDQAFPVFFNDVDWCYRAKIKGWRVYFTPDAEVIHHGGGSTRQSVAEMSRESHRSMKRFYAKHYRKKLFPPVYWFIMFAISINSLFASRLK